MTREAMGLCQGNTVAVDGERNAIGGFCCSLYNRAHARTPCHRECHRAIFPSFLPHPSFPFPYPSFPAGTPSSSLLPKLHGAMGPCPKPLFSLPSPSCAPSCTPSLISPPFPPSVTPCNCGPNIVALFLTFILFFFFKTRKKRVGKTHPNG